MLEFYTAYFDCRDVMATTEALIEAAATSILGEPKAEWNGVRLNFEAPFTRWRMTDAIAQGLTGVLGRSVSAADVEGETTLRAILDSAEFDRAARGAGVSVEAYRKLSHGRAMESLFGDFVEKTIENPTFIVDYPVEISPLAKVLAENRRVADRFELFACGMEIANGFSELNDPLEQRARFEDQLRGRAAGDDEAHQMDDDYVRALGHGLPPTGGCGLGIDRLAMLLLGQKSIRDVILFPQMRPLGRA
jgi:lysyl-tRNA synthetase class 2